MNDKKPFIEVPNGKDLTILAEYIESFLNEGISLEKIPQYCKDMYGSKHSDVIRAMKELSDYQRKGGY